MKEENKRIANENLEILKTQSYVCGKTKYLLSKSIERMISGTKVYSNSYKDGVKISTLISLPKTRPEILITPEDSFAAAANQIINHKTSCVLNFASAKYPGGGFLNGSSAQEEDLCRKSTLYAALSGQEKLYEWSRNNLKNSLYSDWCIYSPNVAIIRNSKLDFMVPLICSVITSPAPNRSAALKNGKVSDLEIDHAMRTRCELILKVAASEKRRNLVLGAFGCGVFGNDPVKVAYLWKDLLSEDKYGKYFKQVVFAIKAGANDDNYKAFKEVFR